MQSLPANLGAFTKAVQLAIQNNFNELIGTTGNVVYLDPVNGNDLNDGLSAVVVAPGSGQGPVKTLAAGYAILRAGKNDILVLISDGTTASSARLSAGFTWAKSAAHFIGMCSPTMFSQRARVAPTAGVTGFANFFTVSGNGCYFKNIEFFQGFTVGIAAEICMTVSGSRNVFENCHICGMADTDAGGGADTGSRNLKLAGGQENLFLNCVIGDDTTARSVANASVEFSGGAARNVFDSCIFPVLATAATVLGVKALTGGIDRFNLFRDCQFINAINSTGVSMTGLGSIGANGGGPNGIIVYKKCTIVGAAEWEQTTKTSVYVDGPTPNSGTGIAVNPA